MSKQLLALFLFLLYAPAALGQGSPYTGFFPDPTAYGTPNATYLTLTSDPVLTNQRILSPSARFIVTDNGAKGTYVLELQTVPAGYGGSGATTYQGGLNNFADNAAGAAAASGDILYRAATNWTRLPKAADGTFLSLSGGIPTWASSPSGAPTTSSYLTLANDAGLSAERVLTAGTGIGFTDTGANGTLTVAVDSTVLTTTSTQTGITNKTFSLPTIGWNGGAGFVMAGTAFNDTIKIADPAAARTITIPDPGTTANICEDQGNYTIAGTWTFSNAPKLNTNTITSSTGLTITFPNATDTLVNLTGTQALSGKTLTSPAIGTQLTLNQTTANYTVNWNNPAAGRTYTIADVGTTADFAMAANSTSYTAGKVAYGNGNALTTTAVGTIGQALVANPTTAPAFQTLDLRGGGIGITSAANQSIIIGQGSNVCAALAKGTANQTLQMDGTATNIIWGSGGTGTVTSFSSGNLSPLFTTSVGTSTTTPALTYSLSNAAAYTVYGNNTSGSAAPAYQTQVLEQLPQNQLHIFGSNASWRAPPTTGTLTGDYYSYGDWTTTGNITCNRCRIYVKGNVTISSTFPITVNTELAGASGTTGAGIQGGSGAGIGGGGGGVSVTWDSAANPTIGGGGGGGNGGAGGGGGALSGGSTGAQGGPSYNIENQLTGSGGGSGCTNGSAAQAPGGAGGGALLIVATGNITVSANITAAGGAGGTAPAVQNASGGGGGSGGTVAMYCGGTWTLSGGTTISVIGGAGGAGTTANASGGAGGGGGRVYVRSTGTATTTGTVTTTGGALGAGAGSFVAAVAGSIGVSDIVGGANYPPRSAP